VDDLVDRLYANADMTTVPALLRDAAASIYALRRRIGSLFEELHEARNVRRSDDQVGLVCATCGDPVESAACPKHAPLPWPEVAEILDRNAAGLAACTNHLWDLEKAQRYVKILREALSNVLDGRYPYPLAGAEKALDETEDMSWETT
jgi:hypothetical protein